VAQANKETQTHPGPTSDKSTQVLSRPHQGTSATQTLAPPLSSDQSTQVLLRPRQYWAYTQTERPATSTRSSWTQVPLVALTDMATDMVPVLVTSVSCQAGAYFDNDVFPPGVPRPRVNHRPRSSSGHVNHGPIPRQRDRRRVSAPHGHRCHERP